MTCGADDSRTAVLRRQPARLAATGSANPALSARDIRRFARSAIRATSILLRRAPESHCRSRGARVRSSRSPTDEDSDSRDRLSSRGVARCRPSRRCACSILGGRLRRAVSGAFWGGRAARPRWRAPAIRVRDVRARCRSPIARSVLRLARSGDSRCCTGDLPKLDLRRPPRASARWLNQLSGRRAAAASSLAALAAIPSTGAVIIVRARAGLTRHNPRASTSLLRARFSPLAAGTPTCSLPCYAPRRPCPALADPDDWCPRRIRDVRSAAASPPARARLRTCCYDGLKFSYLVPAQ